MAVMFQAKGSNKYFVVHGDDSRSFPNSESAEKYLNKLDGKVLNRELPLKSVRDSFNKKLQIHKSSFN